MEFINSTIEDLPLIVEIYNSTIASRMVTADTEPVTIKDKMAWFEGHNARTRPLWMVKEEGVVLAWVSFNNFYGRPAYDGTSEISIYLHPDARNKGYGRTILNYCISHAPALKIHTLLGFIFSHNEPSIRLFKNAGFEQWGMFPDIAIMDGKPCSLSIFGIKTKQLC
jgi:L-amino acid N-acyltransferase YncA